MDMRKLKLEELGRYTVGEYRASDKLPVTLVLDNIRSAANVGSFFRSCDCMGLESLWLCGITAQPPHKEISKTAIGSTSSVNWEYRESIVETINKLKTDGYVIYAVEQVTNSVSLRGFQFPKDKKIAIMFGNEVDGVSQEALPLIDQAIEINQYGTKHSFNVSVCAGILMWEVNRQLRQL